MRRLSRMLSIVALAVGGCVTPSIPLPPPVLEDLSFTSPRPGEVELTGRCTPPVDAPAALRPGARLLAAVEQRLSADGVDGIDVVPANCLSNCQRGCSAAVSGSGKWTYVIGDLDPDRHAEDVIDFARQHRAHVEGVPEWRDRPEHVRKHTIARVPPVKRAASSQEQS